MTNIPKTSKITKVSTEAELLELFGKPGKHIFENISNDKFVDTLLDTKVAEFGQYANLVPTPSMIATGGTGAYTSANTYTPQVTSSVRIPLKEGGPVDRFAIKYVAMLINADQEMNALCEEQPAVWEAYNRLQTLVRLYRE